MGIWNLYFIIKIFLYFVDRIDFHVWQNLIFAASLIYPLKQRWLRILRTFIAIPSAFALLYFDTRFPPFARLVAQQDNLKSFNLNYVSELLGRFIEPKLLFATIFMSLIFFLAKRKLRITSFVLITIFPIIPLYAFYQQTLVSFNTVNTQSTSAQVQSIGIAPIGTVLSKIPNDKDLDNALSTFYKKEATKVVDFGPPPVDAEAFDIVIIQVCSMSWDDLALSGESTHPLFNHFDIVFKNFNSAVSYSGPASIRLLRGSCGQTSHKKLYDAANPQCYLYDQLAQSGFEKQLLMNHDGIFGHMINDIQDYGGLKVKPQDNSLAPTYLLGFDGTPIKEDYAVLSNWYKARLQSDSPRIALYYNTTSLHDGNRYPNAKPTKATETYPRRVKTLLADVDKFITQLDASGRKTIVVVVAEHGANARGDRMQIPFMRENPSPTITHVPLGIHLAGFKKHSDKGPLLVDMPTSYTGLSTLLRNWVADSPFGKNSPELVSYLNAIPSTESVSENEDIIVAQYGSNSFIRYNQSGWAPYINK